MASHAALAPSRIPASTRLPSKNAHSFPTQCSSKRLEVAEFSGLRASSCVTYAKNTSEASFFDLVAAQMNPKVAASTPNRAETVAKLKVAINGFGRIGRNFLRCWHGHKNSPLDVIVVNDSGGVKNASHLLKYDSMLGTFKAEVKIVDDTTISVDGKPIKVVSNRDPLKLPWAELGIDIVIEGTGVFVDGPGAGKHIQAGAKKVIITAPAKGADIPTYVVGVNEKDYGHEVSSIVSNASCTTNCLAPFVKVIDEEFGIVKGTMTTTHSYTGDQRLLDASHRDLRRARAAALNIVPTSTGAAKAVSLVLPQLKGKLNGIALRVPTPNVSVVDLVVNVEKKGITAEDVNAAFRKAAEGPLKGILDVCDVPLVSADFRCTDVSSTIDSSLTMVMGDDMVKVVAWYDNEWGYSQRVVDLAHLVASKWPGVSPKGTGDHWKNSARQTQQMKSANKQDVALVAALDGTVYFVDTNSRKIRWSFSSGQPIYSSYQATVNNDDDTRNASELSDDLYYIDCGDDWELYVHSKRFGKLQKLALSAEEYIKMTPHISEDGEITLGFKKTTAFLVDAKTGQVVRTYGLDNSSSVSKAQATEENALLLAKDAQLIESIAADLGTAQHLIYITRTDYVLQHYSPNSTEILWNLAFADIEAEFRCQGFRSSLDGASPSVDEEVDDIQFPCQMKTAVLRIRDYSLLEFDKLAVAWLGGEARFLPAPIHSPSLGPVRGFPLALPTNEDRLMLALPASEAKKPGNFGMLSGDADIINSTSLSSEIMAKYHMWPFIAAILSIISSVFYNYLTFRKQSRLSKSVEDLKSHSGSGMPKKKKSKRSGNNRNSPNDERREKYLPRENKAGNSTGGSLMEENCGRRIGKLLVSNKEIAKGSNGTVVLEGIYDGRAVAVKRLVQTHHDVALKEIQNLIASDQHPNIVRWYGVEYDQDFVYLALERCTCSLNDFIYVYSESFQSQMLSKDADSNRLPEFTIQLHSMLEHSRNVELWKANGHPSIHLLKLMRDVVSGLAHLHELGIIHRDLKPQNVLIINDKSFCAKLSDMGISKRLVGDMSSLTQHPTGYGSSGWQAPEQLLHERQTRAVDLFSLGCVLFSCVTGGKHPFGDNIERDVNIVNDRKDLFLVENIPEAVDLFSRLLDPKPDNRPKAQEVLSHPFFWTSERRLLFLQDSSDRVELEDRENESELLAALESVGTVALNGKWDEKMEAAFINNICRYRRYKYDSVRDLLRVIRNKSHHYRELPQEIKEILGSHPEGFENYFSCRFPKLLIEVFKVMYRYCKEEEFFCKYIECSVI
ncbi:hypothetical protein GH714_007401 [Hevea brasiliensis]|uniref:Uncharacterized protein n=1 Tax=Hevea brasiliensis TaxID=3981 RepID=A0A6A6MBH2_HEVBR|nr:hypothetical protein GH714_007401 [Hevea brasiliensis]